MSVDWSKYPNFSQSEFACKHTGKCEMQAAFLDKLQALRVEYGQPLTITSGYRHPTHPVEARKGHSNGEHTKGACADIACANGAERFRLVQLALKYGLTRIGVAKTFLHLGIGAPGLPNNVIWDYQ